MTQNRNEIPAKYKWDMTAIYATEDDFNADFKAAEEMIAAYPAHAETMTKDAQSLLAALEDNSAIIRKVMKLHQYAQSNFNVDTSVNAYQAMNARVYDLFNRFGAASYFVSPTLLKMDTAVIDKWYAECPALEAYRRIIDKEQRNKPHTLSDEGEMLMANMGQALDSHDSIYGILTDCDMRFGKIRDEEGKMVELTDSTYVKYLMSTDRRVRRAAFTKLYEGYGQFGNTIATIINGFVKEKVTLAKIRKFPTSLEASVFHDEVGPEIYNNLIDTVGANLSPLYDYYDLKKKVLGLSTFHMYDVYTPLIADYDREYTYEEACEEVLDAVKVLGAEYHDTLKAGMYDKGWFDVFPTRGKRGGAYSSGSYDTEPYILLNFNGKLDDVSTLAHEAGHSMHTYFSNKNNEFQNANYTIFVAEVASTVNELIMARKKLRESESDMEKLSVLNHIMETYKGTLFRQTMFAEFEKLMYTMCEEGQPLTRELLSEKYYEIVKKYFGKGVVCDKQISMEWMRIPHFYYNFYVYKYATCISAASAVVNKIEEQGEAYIEKYLNFLKCGGSKSPLDSLLVADVDMTKPDVIKDALAIFADTVAQFKEIAQRVGMIK